jgi:hypothetical protein
MKGHTHTHKDTHNFSHRVNSKLFASVADNLVDLTLAGLSFSVVVSCFELALVAGFLFDIFVVANEKIDQSKRSSHELMNEFLAFYFKIPFSIHIIITFILLSHHICGSVR